MEQEKTCVHVSDPLQTDGAAVQKKIHSYIFLQLKLKLVVYVAPEKKR